MTSDKINNNELSIPQSLQADGKEVENSSQKPDQSEFINYYRKIAEQGNAEAQFKLAEIYLNGKFVPKNINLGLKYLHEASNNNHDKALFMLGTMYWHGESVIKQNLKQAFEYFEQSSKLGNLDSYNNLGNFYKEGIHMKQDFKQAAFYFQLAAEENNLPAIVNYGNLFYTGQGVDQSFEKAFQLYIKAAEMGLPIAQYNIGCMYEEGIGVTKDMNEAKFWFEKAAKQKFDHAINKLNQNYSQIDKNQQSPQNLTSAMVNKKKNSSKEGCKCIIF